MKTCRLCRVEFPVKPKAHRALYCGRCQKAMEDRWRRESRERTRPAAKVSGCIVCLDPIAGRRLRTSLLAPGQTFCPRCSMIIHSRLTEEEFARLLALRFPREAEIARPA